MTDWVQNQVENYKALASQTDKYTKSNAKTLITLKARQKLFGPFLSYYYKVKGMLRITTKALGIADSGQKGLIKSTLELTKVTKLLTIPFKIFNLTTALIVGKVLAVIAIFAYLSTSFGSTAEKTSVLMNALGGVRDSATNLIDTIQGMDWSPILDPLISAFESVQGFLIDMIVASLNLFSTLLDNMGGVVEGIREILLSINFSPIIESLTLFTAAFVSMVSSIDFTSIIKTLVSFGVAFVNMIGNINFTSILDSLALFGAAFVNMLSSIDLTPLTNGLTTVIEEVGNLLGSINFAGFIDTMTSLVPAVQGFVGLIVGIIFQLVSGIGGELLKLDLSPIIDLLSAFASKIASIDFSGMGGGLDYIIGLIVTLASEMVTVVNIVLAGFSDVAIMLLGLDWSPITDMLILAFGLIAHLVGTFLISATKAFGELFAIFAELMMYLGDVGVFQQLIDITGMLFAAVIFGFSSIFIALDLLGINWESIFGLIVDVTAGFVNFLMDSGLIPFFVDLIQYVVLLLTVFTFVIGGILILFADMASYVTGPLWTIFTAVIGGIVDLIAIASGVALGIISVVFKLMMLPARMFFGLMTGGIDGMFEQVDKVFQEILGIAIHTFSMIGGRVKDMFDGTVKIITAVIMLYLAPFLYVNDKINQIFGVDIIETLGDSLSFMFDWIDGIVDYFKSGFDKLMKPIEDMMDKLEELRDIDITGGVSDAVGDSFLGKGVKGFGNMLGFSQGGIARGPRSGYAAELHGTEAVVPLPDGRTIPVAIQGSMGGGNHTENVTFTINVTGGGDSAKIAKAVSQEVQRAFRTRSRSGGYGRGL